MQMESVRLEWSLRFCIFNKLLGDSGLYTLSIQSLSLSVSRSVVPSCLQPHGLQPTRLLCPWDFPGKDTGIGPHLLLQHHNSKASILKPCSSVGKESACSARDLGLIPRLGRCPGERNGNPLQYPCLENLMDRGAWRATVHGVAKCQARLSD